MNSKKIKAWLDGISTRTGVSFSGDMTLSYNETEKIIGYITELENALDEIEKYFNRPEWEGDNLPSTSHCEAKEDILEIINIAKERIEKAENE